MSTGEEKTIRVGSRKSQLALIQTKHVISLLQKIYPHRKFEIHTMSTIGDRVLNISLPKIGEKSLFTKDLEDALRNGGVDFVVHSLKDLPTSLPAGMAIGAVLAREDPRDALVLNEKYLGKTLKTLPKGCVIGTSSLRRTAQLSRCYPHLTVCDVRGNLNTRLAKLDAPNSKFAGLILAQAGLVRMGWNNRIDQTLEPEDLLYAVGQGALAVECRSNDDEILGMLSKLCCLNTQCRIIAERSFLKTLGGGCSAPVAVATELKRRHEDNIISDFQLELKGAVWSLDGKTEIQDDTNCILDLDENDNDVTPTKKMKIEEKNGDNHIIENNTSPKRRSPDVIDDSKVVNTDGDTSKYDIEALINIHGELFKKCPYSLQHQKDKLAAQHNNVNDDVSDGCPLNIPIGQDFMGVCPYFDTKEKVDLAEKMGPEGKCPITGRKIKDANNEKQKKEEKCPFASTSSSCGKGVTSKPPDSTKLTAENLDKCPFLSQQIKLIDCDANEGNIMDINKNKQPPIIIDNSDSLFCGLYRHKQIKENIFQKCEKLGKNLAENLISSGALDVMKVAQQEIREKN